jgi:hypothetical protein
MANYISSGMHAAVDHISDILPKSKSHSDNPAALKFCGRTTRQVDGTGETYILLTRRALLEHNTKHTSPNGDKTQNWSPSNLSYTAVHTSGLPADEHTAERRHSYRYEQPQLYGPATSLQDHEHHTELGTMHLDQPIEPPCPRPYPVAIGQGDLDHQTGQGNFDYQEASTVQQDPQQAPVPCGDALTGVGAQFSG